MARAKYHFDNIYGNLTTAGGAYFLHQVGDLKCTLNYEVDEHVQIVHEISYIVSGRGRMWIDGREILVEPRMAIVNRVGDRHRIAADDGEELRYFYLGFNFAGAPDDSAQAALRDFFEKTQIRAVRDAACLQEAFIDLFNELLLRDMVSDVMMESCMHRIICSVYRLFTRASLPSYRVSAGETMDTNLAYEVVHYIDSHAEEGRLLSTLSREFGYSYDHISRRFAHVTGESLRDYYNRRRFEIACERLNGGSSVTSVAERMGYRSIHAFSSAFKKRMGVSPSEYLRRRKNEME